MTGSDYIAKVRISDAAGRTLAEPGQRCERVPRESLDWLIADGHVEAAPAAAASRTVKPGRYLKDELAAEVEKAHGPSGQKEEA